MDLIPAIDVLEGKVVRLHKGDYDKVTVYADDPVAQAREFHEAGARRLHVVDLGGARAGKPMNLEIIRGILASVPMAVQVGGGIRDARAAEQWFDAGAQRVVFGTAAIKQPDMVRGLCEQHPGGVIVAVDARAGEVAVEGWLQGTGRKVDDFAKEVDGWGAAALLYTVIERDGTHEGPDVEATAALQGNVAATVIASGGIGSLEHVRALRTAGVREAVCGRALYSGAFSLAEAFSAAAG